ncbi:pyruvate dehydrogenase [acetyl-transferring]-phosphatase 1, mitochondrial-like [Eucyclogobius newberryi]|uniref:pyruvate dehydrogenase [acetyl-transferring]-phosphatase 1, mitochondrial-like n=1 Tax=Eucyclogobius newberryi TaxID=166745 RepID=UPI003B5B5987
MMGRRNISISGLCLLERRPFCSLVSSAPPVKLHGLHYPSGTGDRKYRAQHQAGQMGPAQVNQILKAYEYSHSFPKGSAWHGVLGFHSNMLPANLPSEDRRSAATRLPGRGGVMFGVFDGHAGAACAQAVSHRLFYYMTVAALPLRTLAETESAVEEDRPAPPLLEWHRHPRDPCELDYGPDTVGSLRLYWQDRLQQEEEDEDQEEDEESASAGLVSAFKRLDLDISVEAQVHLSRGGSGGGSGSAPLQVAFSGCTACVALVSNGTLHVANLGDSRAVLGVQEADGSWSAHSLTNDHNAQNQDELQRILGEHPRSERRTVVRHDRLLGQLLPFRGFGNMRFKWSPEMLSRVSEKRQDVTLSRHYLTPPYLSAEPEVARHRIGPRDKFLVLATDGLWELMHRQTVVQLVAQQLTGLQYQRPLVPGAGMTLGGLQRLLVERRGRVQAVLEDHNAATHLLRHTLGDDGYGAVAPNRLVKMLSLPPDLARRYRDDITITVVLLNEPDV